MSNDNKFYKIYNRKVSKEFIEKDLIISNPITDYSIFYSLRTLSYQYNNKLSILDINDENINNNYKHNPISQITIKYKNVNNEDKDKIENENIEFDDDNINNNSFDENKKINDWFINWFNELKINSFYNNNNNNNNYTCIGFSIQNSLDCILKSFFDRNDSIIVDLYSYSGLFNLTNPMGVNVVEVDGDSNGMSPNYLERALKNWKFNHRGLNFPKAIYLIPNSCIVSMNLNRKKELYRIASKYNLIIIEDEQNLNLNLSLSQDKTQNEKGIENDQINEQHQQQQEEEETKSFLSIDFDSRVIRIDSSFNNNLFLNFPINFISTNCKQLLEPIENEIKISMSGNGCNGGGGGGIISNNNLNFLILQKHLITIGIQGFNFYLNNCKMMIIKKRNFTIDLLDKYKSYIDEYGEFINLMEFKVPNSGFYIWIKLLGLNCSNLFIKKYFNNNNNNNNNIDNIQKEVENVKKNENDYFSKIVVVGKYFSNLQNLKSPYIRINFVNNDPIQLENLIIKLSNYLKLNKFK